MDLPIEIVDKDGNRKFYRQCLLGVLSKNENGTPRNLVLYGLDEEIDIRKQQVFITALIPEENIKEL